MFELKTTVSEKTNTDVEDQSTIKNALTALGHYNDDETGLSPYADKKLYRSVKDFQKENNLKIDGVIKPDGETQKTIKERLKASPQSFGAFKDFTKNYLDMRKADTINADKYFHCKANYEASKRGWRGNEIAIGLRNDREAFDKKLKGDSDSDVAADQKANKHGRKAAKSRKFKSAKEACAIFRPRGLDDKY